MLENSSLSSDDPLHPGNLFYNISTLPLGISCYIYKPTSSIFFGFYMTFVLLLLPLCIFILHHGLQQWRQKRSTSSAAAMSHSDCFAYHMVTMQIIGLFGCAIFCYSIYNTDLLLLVFGGLVFHFTWYGQTLFEVLTCVERYLAVVHPITYMSLRNEKWIRIRNISVSCVWLLCIIGVSLSLNEEVIVMDFFLLMLALPAISFCSVAVLRVLLRPGPGGRRRVDKAKQRAFYTILAILGVLVLKVAWGLIENLAYVSEENYSCVLTICEVWFNIPSSLLLPLLFLHRAGKLGCC